MKTYNTIQQTLGAGHTFDGVVQAGPTLTHPAGADGSGHRLWAYADNAHGGLFNPAVFGGPARVRYLQRVLIDLHASVAWTIDIIDEGGAVRMTVAFSATNQRQLFAGMGLEIMPGEKIRFTAATYGVVTMSFSEDN